MQPFNFLKALAGPLVVIVLLGVGWQTHGTWTAWLIPGKDAPDNGAKTPPSDNPERINLSEQAKKNLRDSYESNFARSGRPACSA